MAPFVFTCCEQDGTIVDVMNKTKRCSGSEQCKKKIHVGRNPESGQKTAQLATYGLVLPGFCLDLFLERVYM